MNLKKSSCILASIALVLAATFPTVSSASGVSNSHNRVTWQEFVNKHPNIYVEYKYSPKTKTSPLYIAQQGTSKTKVPAGTPVIIKIIDTINSGDVTTGTSLTFSVLQDVKIDNLTVIKAGSLGQAQIAASEDAGRIGQPGKITITDFSVKAVDGTYVPLRGTISGKGSDKVVTSGALSILICPLFLLMKGGEAIIPAGTEKTTYTGADVEVSVQQQ